MFQQLMTILKGEPAPPPDPRMAVAVLLIEAARRDDHFGAEEQAAICDMLRTRFGLNDEESTQLLERSKAEQREMVQLQPYTHAIFEALEPADRVGVIEMLWELAYADGELHAEEDALIRKIAGLIYVEDRERMLARKRVLERMGKA